MQFHRFRNQLASLRISEMAPSRASESGFMACPAALFVLFAGSPAQWQRHVYELAFREAQAVVRPSILERDLLGVWN